MKRLNSVWKAEGLPTYPKDQVETILKAVKPEYGDLCGSFYLFRYLHRFADPDCTLLGDYCFGIFSAYLAELDSVPLNDAFSDWLKKDTVTPMSFSNYLQFVREQCGGNE